MRMVVYTCITDNYDSLKEPLFHEGIDFICYTNTEMKSKVWQFRECEGGKLAQRKIKILGTEEINKYDKALWIDGSIQLTKDVRQLLSSHNKPTFKLHHSRDNIFDEAIECIRQGKIPKEKAFEQVGKYIQDWGWLNWEVQMETGIMVKTASPIWDYWWHLFEEFPYRDQLSLPIAMINEDYGWLSHQEFQQYYRLHRHK